MVNTIKELIQTGGLVPFLRAASEAAGLEYERIVASKPEKDYSMDAEANRFVTVQNDLRGLAAYLDDLGDYRRPVEDAPGVIGYMCKVDFECELGAASGGTGIHPCLEDLRERRKCVSQCGIVEVEVKLRAVVQESNYDAEFDEVQTEAVNQASVDFLMKMATTPIPEENILRAEPGESKE